MLLYHINTKTAIPLYRNCGFCLAERVVRKLNLASPAPIDLKMGEFNPPEIKLLDKLKFVVNYSNLIFPVFVFISHLPPIASPIGVLGISILPVLVRAINTILDDSLPQTLPVLVFTKMSGAEQSFNKTFPVPRLTQMLSVAVNLFNEMHPVFPFE